MTKRQGSPGKRAATTDHKQGTSDGGIIMGVRHRELPIEAVQFHPESILTLTPGANYGLQLIENAVRLGKTARMGGR